MLSKENVKEAAQHVVLISNKEEHYGFRVERSNIEAERRLVTAKPALYSRRSFCNFILAGLSVTERKRGANVFMLTLGPHGSGLKHICEVLKPGFEQLDRGI